MVFSKGSVTVAEAELLQKRALSAERRVKRAEGPVRDLERRLQSAQQRYEVALQKFDAIMQELEVLGIGIRQKGFLVDASGHVKPNPRFLKKK